MGSYAGEIKCTFYGRKPQFDETPCSNFVDAGEVVCNLDKPKPQLVPSRNTAADIINEHIQQEADLRDEIRKKYNIEGDISEEQYKQLCAIYKEEEKNTATPNVEKKKTKQTINKETVWIIAIVLGLGIIFGGLFLWNSYVDRKNAEILAERAERERIKQEQIRQNRIEQEQREKERIEQERKKQELEQYRLEQERRENAAPYGYNEYGEPFDSKESAQLDKRLTDWENARNDFFMTDNPLEKMYYQQQMRRAIYDCCELAKQIGDRRILAEMIKLREATDALSNVNNW